MTDFHLGIDVAKTKLDCALRLPNGKFRSKVIANSAEGFVQLIDWLASHQASQPHVCMEATGIYWEDIAQFLAAAGFTVSVVNPAQPGKTERNSGSAGGYSESILVTWMSQNLSRCSGTLNISVNGMHRPLAVVTFCYFPRFGDFA